MNPKLINPPTVILNGVAYRVVREFRRAPYAQQMAHKTACKWTCRNGRYLVLAEKAGV